MDLNWVYALGLQALSVLVLVYLLTVVASVTSTATATALPGDRTVPPMPKPLANNSRGPLG